MTPKQRENLAGQVIAACNIMNQVNRELVISDAEKETKQASKLASERLRKLLRKISFEEYTKARFEKKL